MKLKDKWQRMPKFDPEREEQRQRELEESGITVGWKDHLAMLIAAFVTLVLPCALLLLLVVGIPLLLMALL